MRRNRHCATNRTINLIPRSRQIHDFSCLLLLLLILFIFGVQLADMKPVLFLVFTLSSKWLGGTAPERFGQYYEVLPVEELSSLRQTVKCICKHYISQLWRKKLETTYFCLIMTMKSIKHIKIIFVWSKT